MLMREGPLQNHKGTTVAASAATVNVRAARLHQHYRIELHARHLFSHLDRTKNPSFLHSGMSGCSTTNAVARRPKKNCQGPTGIPLVGGSQAGGGEQRAGLPFNVP